MSNNGVADMSVKPHSTSGKGKKWTFGMPAWNLKGMEYFEEAKNNWMGACTKTDPQNKILREYWDKAVDDKGQRNLGCE